MSAYNWPKRTDSFHSQWSMIRWFINRSLGGMRMTINFINLTHGVSIFSRVTLEEFRQIMTCKTFKEAWDIHSMTRKGWILWNSQSSKNSPSDLRCYDEWERDIHWFFTLNIANPSFNLREKISGSKVVGMTSRSDDTKYGPQLQTLGKRSQVSSRGRNTREKTPVVLLKSQVEGQAPWLRPEPLKDSSLIASRHLEPSADFSSK